MIEGTAYTFQMSMMIKEYNGLLPTSMMKEYTGFLPTSFVSLNVLDPNLWTRDSLEVLREGGPPIGDIRGTLARVAALLKEYGYQPKVYPPRPDNAETLYLNVLLTDAIVLAPMEGRPSWKKLGEELVEKVKAICLECGELGWHGGTVVFY